MNRENIYNVPAKVWSRWSVVGREVFNSVYAEIKNTGAETFCGPHLNYEISEAAFDTIAWNAAFVAAEKWARPNQDANVQLICEWMNERMR